MLVLGMREKIETAAVLVAGTAMMLWISIQTFKDLTPWEGDNVAIAGRRLAPLRAELESRGLGTHGLLGYVSRVPKEGNLPADSGGSGQDFILAQYVLAPWVLVNEADRPDLPFVVGELPGPESVQAILEANHLAIVVQYPEGVFLLRRANP